MFLFFSFLIQDDRAYDVFLLLLFISIHSPDIKMSRTVLCTHPPTPKNTTRTHISTHHGDIQTASNTVMVSNHIHPSLFKSSSRRKQTVRSPTHCNCGQSSHLSHHHSHPPHHTPSARRCSAHYCMKTGLPGTFCWRMLSQKKVSVSHDHCHWETRHSAITVTCPVNNKLPQPHKN